MCAIVPFRPSVLTLPVTVPSSATRKLPLPLPSVFAAGTSSAPLRLTFIAPLPGIQSGSGAMKVSLSGAEEVPAAKTDGKGSGSFRVAEDGTVTGSVSTEGLKGTMAHIHQGAKGQNGPVIVPLTKNGDTYSVPE